MGRAGHSWSRASNAGGFRVPDAFLLVERPYRLCFRMAPRGRARVSVSEKPAVKSSYTVARFLAAFKRKQARADAKAANAARTAAVPTKAVKIA
jgi:hypothetical protein